MKWSLDAQTIETYRAGHAGEGVGHMLAALKKAGGWVAVEYRTGTETGEAARGAADASVLGDNYGLLTPDGLDVILPVLPVRT